MYTKYPNSESSTNSLQLILCCPVYMFTDKPKRWRSRRTDRWLCIQCDRPLGSWSLFQCPTTESNENHKKEKFWEKLTSKYKGLLSLLWHIFKKLRLKNSSSSIHSITVNLKKTLWDKYIKKMSSTLTYNNHFRHASMRTGQTCHDMFLPSGGCRCMYGMIRGMRCRTWPAQWGRVQRTTSGSGPGSGGNFLAAPVLPEQKLRWLKTDISNESGELDKAGM